jgi:hypothetical protein
VSLPLRPQPGAGSPTLALRYLSAAAAAYVVAAHGVAWLAPALTGHYYHPRLLALTHLVTLGWITLAIMGAGYQLVPMVLGRPMWSERLARWQFWALAAAIPGMVSHFYIGTWLGLSAAAALLAVGIAAHLFNVGMTLRGFRGWTFTARAVVLAYAGLALTALFGLALAANHVRTFWPGEFFATLHAHIHLALLGWVAPMMFGVTTRVYPMFLLSPEPSRGLGAAQFWGLAAGVPALVVGLLAAPLLVPLAAVVLAAGVAAHVVAVIGMVRGRKRPGLDWGLRATLVGAAFLPPVTAMGLAFALGWLSGPRAALGYGVLVLGGWISLTIVGMMLKIVPFLVWYRVYGPQAGRAPVPTLAQLCAPRAEALAVILLAAGTALLAVTVVVGDVTWIRAAGVVLALGALAFAVALGRVLRHLAATPTPRLAPPAAVRVP